MGWQSVRDVPIAIRPARPYVFLRGLRHVAGPPSGPPPEVPLAAAPSVLGDRAAVQDLLDHVAQPMGRMRTDRDAGYLHWRYARAPGLDYRVITCTGQGGGLRGLAIGRPRRRGRLVELTLTEVIVRAGDRAAARELLAAAARCGVDHVATHLDAWPTAARARRYAGYVCLPGARMSLVARPVATDRTGIDSSRRVP